MKSTGVNGNLDEYLLADVENIIVKIEKLALSKGQEILIGNSFSYFVNSVSGEELLFNSIIEMGFEKIDSFIDQAAEILKEKLSENIDKVGLQDPFNEIAIAIGENIIDQIASTIRDSVDVSAIEVASQAELVLKQFVVSVVKSFSEISQFMTGDKTKEEVIENLQGEFGKVADKIKESVQVVTKSFIDRLDLKDKRTEKGLSHAERLKDSKQEEQGKTRNR